jgi:hypothetical protein
VTTIDDEKLLAMVGQTNAAVTRRPRSGVRTIGYVDSVVSTCAIGNRIIRFPHALVLPIFHEYFGLFHLPMFVRGFSQPGDSGSWVFAQDNGSWIGMVIGGSDKPHRCYVALGSALLDYFSLTAFGNPRSGPTDIFTPFALE